MGEMTTKYTPEQVDAIYAAAFADLKAADARDARARDLAPELVEALRGLLAARDADVATGRLQFSSNPDAADHARALLAKIDGEQA
jgi:hypothetical protein